MSTRRPTRQRAAVEALLRTSDDFVSAQAIHARLRETGDAVGLATVYRTLQALSAEGLVDLRDLPRLQVTPLAQGRGFSYG